MPNIKSAAKSMRTSAIKRMTNRSAKSGIKTVRMILDAAATEPDQAKKTEVYRRYCSIVDKAAKKGIIKKNKADRSKSRAAKRLTIK